MKAIQRIQHESLYSASQLSILLYFFSYGKSNDSMICWTLKVCLSLVVQYLSTSYYRWGLQNQSSQRYRLSNVSSARLAYCLSGCKKVV